MKTQADPNALAKLRAEIAQKSAPSTPAPLSLPPPAGLTPEQRATWRSFVQRADHYRAEPKPTPNAALDPHAKRQAKALEALKNRTCGADSDCRNRINMTAAGHGPDGTLPGWTPIDVAKADWRSRASTQWHALMGSARGQF